MCTHYQDAEGAEEPDSSLSSRENDRGHCFGVSLCLFPWGEKGCMYLCSVESLETSTPTQQTDPHRPRLFGASASPSLSARSLGVLYIR